MPMCGGLPSSKNPELVDCRGSLGGGEEGGLVGAGAGPGGERRSVEPFHANQTQV